MYYNLYNCMNLYYTICILYEFVLVNLYTKISEKKICIRVGISTRDQYPRLKSLPSPPRPLCHWPFFIS